MAWKDYREHLREKALERLPRTPGSLDGMSREEIGRVVEELRIHQIELEIQNEELRRVQKTLEDSRNRYARLFDNAPVGYIVLDGAGIIRQYNTTFADLVGSRALEKTHKAFADLLAGEDGPIFRSRFPAFFKQPSGKRIEAGITTADGRVRHVQIQATAHSEKTHRDDPGRTELLLMITDITELKQAKIDLEEALADVKQLSGLLPICSHCKKIRDDKGYWNQLEAYIHEHSNARFSHSICRECAEKYYPGYDIYEE